MIARRVIACVLAGAMYTSASAQVQPGAIEGTVTAQVTGDPLAGANVLVGGTFRGTTTDAGGTYRISGLKPGSYSLTFSVIGYMKETRHGVRVESGAVTRVDVALAVSSIETDPVIVTASRREQTVQESPVSISVMEAGAIAYRNAVTIDDALRYVPGVNITYDQVNVRGSSGYSRAAGSRVLLLVDGIPMLTGDTGEINFDIIPVGQIERIEVLKGASSALYGSSALGGVINVITQSPPDAAETRIRTFLGLYSNPSYRQWEWSDRTRMYHGFSMSHAQKVGDLGVLVHGARTFDDSYRQNDFRHRYNGLLKSTYDLSTTSTLNLSFNILHQRRASFLYWKDINNVLVPTEDQVGDGVRSTRFNIAGQLSHILDGNLLLKAKGLWFRNDWSDTIEEEGNTSQSDVVRGEVQATWSLDARQLVTAGAEGNTDNVRSNLFGSHAGKGLAAYAQHEFTILNGLQSTLGARYDRQELEGLGTNTSFNPKAALVYRPATGTSLRSSFGRGFRSPTVAEVFITTTAGGFPIVPNPALRSERSTSFELGLNQLLGTIGILDIAFFSTRYKDLIETGFNEEGNGQFRNVTDARISGVESSLKIALVEQVLFVDLSHTYLAPRDLTAQTTLKYRPRNLLYAGMLVRIGAFSAGVDFRYLSRIERIDEEFVVLGIIKDGNQRVATYVTDLRFGLDLAAFGIPGSATLSFNNVFQYNYVEIIGNMAPPRTTVFVLEGVF